MKRGDTIPNDIARLKGSRFVAAIESDEDKRLSESLIKQLTGQDRISARFMRSEWFDFNPTFKIWLATNHKPVIRGTDHAIWRRIRLIPFTVTIPDEEQDEELVEKLKEEHPGILNWAVEGARKWQKKGLEVAEKVKVATAQYRLEMDVLAGFLEDCCLIGPRYEATSKDLYIAYTAWCEANGEQVMTQIALGLRLEERGFSPKRTERSRLWTGIGLMTHL